MSPPARAISTFYFVWFGALGLFVPYAAPYFRSIGFSEADASRLLSILPAMALVTPPFVGLLADARRARPHLLRALTAAAAIAFCGLSWAAGQGARFFAIAAVLAMFAFARGPVTALADAAANECALSGETSYGRIRLWGSIGFLVAVAGIGPLLDRRGTSLVPLLSAGGLIAAAMVAWRVPAARLSHRPGVLASSRALLLGPGFLAFLGAVALAQVAAGAYDSCFALHLERLHLSKSWTGVLLATGVLSEVFVLRGSAGWFARVSPWRLFAIAIGVASLRWAAMSLSAGAGAGALPILCLLAPLHGITFGLWFVAAVQIAHARGRAVPTAAQGLLAAAASLGSMVGMAGAGQLLAIGGGRLLFGVASLAALAGAGLAARAAISDGRVSTGQGTAALTEEHRALG